MTITCGGLSHQFYLNDVVFTNVIVINLTLSIITKCKVLSKKYYHYTYNIDIKKEKEVT